MADIQIRLAGVADTAEILALNGRAFAHYHDRLGTDSSPEFERRFAAEIANGAVHVAEADGQIIGFLFLEFGGGAVIVEQLGVEPERQRQGIGRALLTHTEAVGRAAGCDRIELLTAEEMRELIAYYLQRGFMETGRGPNLRHDDGHTRVYFEKRLA